MTHSPVPIPLPSEDVRTGTSVESIRRDILDHLSLMQARFAEVATKNDWYLALAYAVRDRLLARWLHTARTYMLRQSRTVCYLSAEFLLGPHLGQTMLALGIEETVREALAGLGHEIEPLLEQEEEPGLGNGGLGRLAACFMESLATLDIPAIGYGIRYEFGIFDQAIRDGWQVELGDTWLRLGYPWEIQRPEIAFAVGFGGRTETYRDERGRTHVRWIPERHVRGIACDTPILGYRTGTASLLRLWKAAAQEEFDLGLFNVGDYTGAVRDKVASENISKVLYPSDARREGKDLRLQQQYFFVSCTLQDMIRLHLQRATGVHAFHEKFAAQLNDTHPAVAIAELMRLLVDVHGFEWEPAWEITRETFAYTNHTLMPEALERWPLGLFGALLPRHLEIVFEINRRFLDEVREAFPGDEALVRRVSLVDESGERYVRMAHLAVVGSHAVNGVAALHTELLKQSVLRDFHRIFPDRVRNVTNGVTPRRFVALANPGLAALVTERLGHDGWIADAERLRGLEAAADEPDFQDAWLAVKLENKRRLAGDLAERTGVSVDPASLFDVQVKRIHEYKRQHLNLLHALWLYRRLLETHHLHVAPVTKIFGGKAAPGYHTARLIIKLAHAVAAVVNADPRVDGRLKVVFAPDFNVKNGQRIYPAAELSEQISTAGLEASGTGNMKMMLNGALTIGTLDGANVEIREAAGAEHFFLFGHTVEEVERKKAAGYRPAEVVERDPELRAVLELVLCGHLSPGDKDLFRPLVDGLLARDEYFLLADFRSYVECQERAARTYLDRRAWARSSILNVARGGRFSSDRSIREYARDVWHVAPVAIGT